MPISADFLFELKGRLDIVDFIQSNGVTLTRTGTNYKGLCPFHSEKSPSFVVYEDTQSFYCFGCGSGGDAITFSMKTNQLQYPEAIETLANYVGLPIPTLDRDTAEMRLKNRILEMNRIMAKHYFSNLNKEEGKVARQYLKQRGISHDTIKKFGLGFALDNWQDGISILQKKGYTQEEIVQGNLGRLSKNNGLYDQFRNRIIFPILDLKGNVIGFGGRNLGEQGPKYLNTAETPVFFKHRNLYGLNFAKNKKNEEPLLLVEGYMDVVGLYQGGFSNAVATLGTAMGDSQALLLSKYGKKVILCYDGDEAGQKAAQRAIGILNKTPLLVQVLQLKGAKDPDEYIQKYGPLRFAALLKKSEHFFDYQLEKITKSYDLSTTEGTSQYLRALITLLLTLPNQSQIEQNVRKIAKEQNFHYESLMEDIKKEQKRQHYGKRIKEKKALVEIAKTLNQKATGKDGPQSLKGILGEETLIPLLLKQPELVLICKKYLGLEDMISPFHGEVIAYLYEHSTNLKGVEFMDLSLHFSEDALQQISKYIANFKHPPFTESQLKELIHTIKEGKHTPKDKEIIQMSEEEASAFIQTLREQKIGRNQ